ncbi:klarsicht protein isoform X3 [Bactrocera oleae]|uniref:klarsicht protein isoform X3 n=1 Tax=Bactrocera oleae TaxID=104688 RepID=UPI00387E5DA7
MDSPKREKVNVTQLHHYQQTLNIRNTINNTNTTNLNENEHEIKGTTQSTDTSELCRDEESKFSPVKIITPPISKSAGGKLTDAVPKTIEAVVNKNEETENAAMVYVDASKMSPATPTNTNPISIPKTMVNTLAITTIEDTDNMQSNSKVSKFVVPAIPDTKAINKNGGVGGTGTSAKKKRNKSSKKREDNKTRNKSNSSNIAKGVTDGNRCQPNISGSPINVIVSGTANMKASVSMTSLPPDDEKTEGRDVIKAKLNVERPYNSLKKNIERNAVNTTLGVRAHCFSHSQSSTSSFANHRYSWGSGYSYSSSSLQSSATFGLGSAKDDLWAAIQTNYNYIMDTNLLDSCKETERHLADQNEAYGVECEQSQCAQLLGVTQRREISWHDPKELRKWLREMEERLEYAPTLSTVTTLTTAELQHCLAEHSVLYHEIVSHARVVSACIRSATEEHQGQVLLQQQHEEEQQLQSIDSCSTTIAEQTNSSLTSNEKTTLTIATAKEQINHEFSGASSSSDIETAEKSSFSPGPSFIRPNTASPQRTAETKITEDSLERLQNRYHLLYLKAFEVQLWLDGLLRKKSSTASIVNAAGYIDDNDNVNCHSSDCEEDEAAATEDDLNIIGSGIESDITQNSSSIGELRDCIDLVEEENRVAEKNEMSYSVRWHPKTVIDPTNKTSMQHQQMQKMESKKILLPPHSTFKPEKSLQSTAQGDNFSPTNVTKGKLSHESIKQLVLEAEHLVRDAEALKTPNKSKQKHSVIKLSSTVKKRENAMSGPIKQRVQEWLEHQPSASTTVQGHRNLSEELQSGAKSKAGDDCEASGEASETDSVPQLGSDTSEGLTESIATCMQTSTNSFGGNSTECFASSAEPIVSSAPILGYGSSNQSLNVKIVKRSQSRRKSERPWSVSCLSQLTTGTVPIETIAPVVDHAQTGLATHSISESALDSLSPSRQRVSSSSTINVIQVKSSNSKGSLKRRKTRKKKMSTSGNLGVVATNSHSVVKKSPDSGSEDTAAMPRLTQTLLMKSCESMSTQQIREITSALLCLHRGNGTNLNEGATGTAQYTLEESQQHAMPQSHKDMDEGVPLMKPNFRVGSYTTAHMRNEKRLGSLAALATYMNDEEEEQQGEYTTGTEDHHSSFSETAWDNYQEKYNSENYSEGFDSDAARKLMEFGDDYRNFIDSQSDCCSSLSAANNLDSLSPPRMDSLQQADTKTITQDTIANSVDHARRRRALDLEYERRRKTLEVRRKSCQDSTDAQNTRSPIISTSSSVNAITPRIGFEKMNQQKKSDLTGRKLEFGMSQSAQSLRRTSESDTSTRRRKIDDRRRSSRNLDKSIKVIPATSSSSCDDSDDEKEMRNLLQQSRNRLEDTEALKIRCHLLRPEDYTEIISTCRDNIRCLEAVLRGPPGTVLSAQCAGQTKDLLAAWEDLLSWSENAASARKMQEEMITLKHSLSKLGDNGIFELLDTEPQIQVAIEALKNEKSELQNYRTNMLRLNASVHSWLTRQERRLQNAIAAEQLKDSGKVYVEPLSSHIMPSVAEGDVAKCSSPVTLQGETNIVTTNINDATKNMSSSIATSTVGSNAKVLDIQTLINAENEFHKHLKNEVSGMYSAWDDADARINTQLETLTNSLLAWKQLESGLYEFQQALGHDRGTLKGLEGVLDKGQATPVELAQNVKVVAKLLSERVNVSEEQLTAVREHLDPNHILHIAKFTASNGSLSDSGISDGGATSDGGLSERERRLGVLRRLVKQLELALAPGSEAMKSIAVRMESAEAELKNLQNTCRDLIVRTAASHQNKKIQQKLQKTEAQQQLVPVTDIAVKGTETSKTNDNSCGKKESLIHDQNSAIQYKAASTRNGRRKQNKRPSGSDNNVDNNNGGITNNNLDAAEVRSYMSAAAPDSGDPADDPDIEFDLDTSNNKNNKVTHNSWAWRIAKAAVPMQLALITFLCAACLMQPNCCDNLNNLSMSFTPQLRYIRGPPPI